MPALLEHANVTVTDADKTARWMSDLFGWHIRWQGPSQMGGQSLHIGTDTQYIALYEPSAPIARKSETYVTAGGLNHLAVTVDDIETIERKVRDAGFTPTNHGDYEPGRRFYFHDHDSIEFEIVQYD
ncbi:MAG: VOC family protein [Roseobacter sp.]